MAGTAGESTPSDVIGNAAVQRERLVTLGRLTAGIAHELNNPIGYIASNLNSLGRYARTMVGLVEAVEILLPSEQRGVWRERLEQARWDYLRNDLPVLVDETRQGADQLKHVVAELKGLARHATIAEDATLDDCVHAALIVVGTAVRRHAVISLDLTADRPASLVRAQIIQLIINLVMNAVEAFGDRPVSANSIRIATCAHDDVLTLCVEDNGPGVAPLDRSLIFTPFHTTKSEGTGLGLSIAARIVADHGGSITCDASPDLGGARFVVMLRGWKDGAAGIVP